MLRLINIGGVFEDVLGLEDILEDAFWSPWPWPQRSNPRHRNLKFSKIPLSLARGQHYFLNCWNFAERLKKFLKSLFFEKNFLIVFVLENAWKKFLKTFFLEEHLRLCAWSLASSISVLGVERVCPRKDCPWPWIFFVLCLKPCVLDSSSVNQ